MFSSFSSKIANTMTGAKRQQNAASHKEEKENPGSLPTGAPALKTSETPGQAVQSETPLTNLPRRYVLETPKVASTQTFFAVSGAAAAPTAVVMPAAAEKSAPAQPSRGRSMFKSTADRAASVDVSRFVRTPGVDLDNLAPPAALQSVKLPRKLRQPATAVAASLPKAAKAPTPKNMVHAAKDMDALRNEVWSPITNTETYQKMDERLKKHSTAHAFKNIVTRGPLMTYVDYRKEKKAEKQEERKAAAETRKSMA